MDSIVTRVSTVHGHFTGQRVKDTQYSVSLVKQLDCRTCRVITLLFRCMITFYESKVCKMFQKDLKNARHYEYPTVTVTDPGSRLIPDQLRSTSTVRDAFFPMRITCFFFFFEL